MLFVFFSLLLLCTDGLAKNVSDFVDWKPDLPNGLTYCESVSGGGQMGGIACGRASYEKMQKYQPALTIFEPPGTSLGLLNIVTISKAAYTTHRDFYQVCKKYFIRLYDGLYKDISQTKCLSAFPAPDGIDTSACNDSSNVIIKSGSGFCMTEQACGATIPIYFLKDPVDSTKGITWSWDDGAAAAMGFLRLKPVGTCYGYELKAHTVPKDSTIKSS